MTRIRFTHEIAAGMLTNDSFIFGERPAVTIGVYDGCCNVTGEPSPFLFFPYTLWASATDTDVRFANWQQNEDNKYTAQ